MKKIVGILAAAAVLATSVFAADVSAKVKLTGELLSVNGDNDKTGVSAFGLNPHRSHDWEPDLNLSFSSDKAGAEIAFRTLNEWGSGEGETSTNWKIWFKPIDVLKFNIGRIGDSLNTESIDYSNRVYNYDEWGYRAEFSSNGFTLAAALHYGQGGWFLNQYIDKNGNSAIGISSLAVFASYGADFGTISALFDVKTVTGTKHAATAAKKEVIVDPVTGLPAVKTTPASAEYWTRNDGSLFAGAGYKGQFGSLGLFVDFGFKTTLPEAGEGTSGIYGDIDVKFAQDAFYFEVYGKLSYANLKATTDPIGILAIAKASYQLDPCTIYAYFKSENFLAKANAGKMAGKSVFPAVIKLGAQGSCGACGWNIWGEIDVNPNRDSSGKTLAYTDKVDFKIPVEFTVAW